MIKRRVILIGIVMIGLLLSGHLLAKEPAGSSNTQLLSKSSQNDGWSIVPLNLSRWEYWIKRDGQSAHDPSGQDGGYYPNNQANVIYQDGLLWGGIVRDTRNPSFERMRVGGQTFRIGTNSGHIVTSGTASTAPVASDANLAFVYRIRKDWESLQIGQASLINDAASVNQISASSVSDQMQQDILDAYRRDWENWPVELGAPFEDSNGNGIYEPDLGETPGIANADQVIWLVVNDLDEGRVSNLSGTKPIGLELQMTLWCYNQPSSTLGQLIFKRFRLINKSGLQVDSMYVGQWSDPDCGTAVDDLVGCDVERSLGFVYTGSVTDNNFSAIGLNPAAGGYDFFQGPLVDGVAGQDLNNNGVDDASDFGLFNLKQVGPGKINLPLTSFGYFASGSTIPDPDFGEYNATLQVYNLLNGNIPTSDTLNPSPYTSGFGENVGQPTKFPLSGNPVGQTGDLDAFGSNLAPGDRRMILNSGPFTMMPGDTQEVVVAVIGGIVEQDGGNNRNAVAQLKLNDDFAQFIFNKRFEGIPSPPVAPDVKATPLEDKIILEWGSNLNRIALSEAKDPLLGFNFEGYNVYQLPNANAPKSSAIRITTFDLNNLITQINSDRFVPDFGDIISVPIQKGTNTGIQRYFVIEKDYINDAPLFAGNEYYFAITAYNAKDEDGDGAIDKDVPESSLESAFEIITVVPQGTRPGIKYTSEQGEALDVNKSGFSTGNVDVVVVDPNAITGDSYMVSFNDTPNYSTDANGDTLGTWFTWNLLNTTQNKTLLTNQSNLAGDNDYAVTDGLLVKVAGPKTAGLANWGSAGDRWVTGVNWNAPQFFGGLDVGANFFGSNLSVADLVPIQLVWQDSADVATNGYVSKGAVYRRDTGYSFSGIGQLPLAAYDVTDPANPRQVNVSFVEDDNESQANGSAANLIWDMGWNPTTQTYGANGAREYIFINLSDYSEGAGYDDSNTGFDSDVLYAIWPDQRGTRPYLLAEFTMDIIINIPNNMNDSYAFSTKSVIRGDKEFAKDEVDRINVFPNPYYAYNPEEPNRFSRFITFNHLPENVTIRIFTLSGVQVRKLTSADKQTPESQFLRWNLQNEANIPVASGVYIAHIDMPDLNKTKVLKLFIVQAQEILDYF
ncbi:MAG: T9SS type A sorting domain-containing protein [Calditrichaeota bacterium]|nr:T9SS type A sorting domain-containing protein [Calditrichota bacterium]